MPAENMNSSDGVQAFVQHGSGPKERVATGRPNDSATGLVVIGIALYLLYRLVKFLVSRA